MNIEVSPRNEREMTHLTIVDDHKLARESLQDMLADEPSIEIVGEASNGQEALTLCSRVQPDLVLMDVRMPNMDGLEATREIKRRYPRVAVLMLTMHENPDYLLQALKAGAAGYILKDAFQEEVINAVLQVREGEFPMDARLSGRLLRRLATESRGPDNQPSPGGVIDHTIQPLTAREIEVLALVRLGHANRQVARELFISLGTVKRHVEHIIAKLGVSDRTQAVVRALELKILNLAE